MLARKPLAILLAGLGVVLVGLAGGLRPDAFFAGDPGVKLIAARNAAARPAHPLEIPLPVIGLNRIPLVEPFFQVHGDHAHAVTSELFPVLTAPLLALFGLRGAFLLPALGFLLAIGACAKLGTSLDPRRHTLAVVAMAALGTPLLFYGLELWEHTLAVAAAAIATTLVVRNATGTRAFVAGVLFGLALLLRPEAGWYAAATLVAARFLPTPLPLKRALLLIAGLAVAVAPSELYTISHFGSILPPHVAVNSSILGQGWLAARKMLLTQWFIDPSDISFWRVSPAILLAFVPLTGPSVRNGRRFLYMVALLTMVLVVLTAPNAGGGQWGPRYLLCAYIPLAILAADAAQAAAERRTVAAILLLGATLGLTAWQQRRAYRTLQSTKAVYGRMVDFVARQVPEHGVALTDLWWLDQVTAAATEHRSILFVPDDQAAADAIRRLDEARVPSITVIRDSSLDRGSWGGGTCYAATARQGIPERSLEAVVLRRSCI